MRIKILKTQGELVEAYALRYNVYCLDKKYLNPDDYPDGLESDEYDAASVHIGCYEDETLVGYARVIQPSARPFPIEKHFSIEDVPGGKFSQCEVSRLIVASGYRGNPLRVLKPLVKAIVFESEKRQLFNAFVVVEEPLLKVLCHYGLPFRQIGPITRYMNTDNYPCVVSASDISHSKIGLSDNWQSRFVEEVKDDELVVVV